MTDKSNPPNAPTRPPRPQFRGRSSPEGSGPKTSGRASRPFGRNDKPKTSSVPGRRWNIPVGFYLPGVVAFVIHTEANERKSGVIPEVRKLEGFGWLTCPACGAKCEFSFLEDAEINDLAEIARTKPYRELYLDIEKRFSDWTPRCACGTTWKVNPRVGGRDDNESDLPF